MFFSLFTKNAPSNLIFEFSQISKANMALFMELALTSRFPASPGNKKQSIEQDEDAFAYADAMNLLIRYHGLNKPDMGMVKKIAAMQTSRIKEKTAYTDGAYSLLLALVSVEHIATTYYQHFPKDEEIFAMLNAQMAAITPVISRMFGYSGPSSDFQQTFPKLSDAIKRFQNMNDD